MKVSNLLKGRAMRAALFVLLLSLAGMTNALAQSFSVGDLNYSVNGDGTSVTVTGVSSSVYPAGEGFDSGIPDGWVSIDNDGDGDSWSSWMHYGDSYVFSNPGYYNTDNYLVTNAVNFSVNTVLHFKLWTTYEHLSVMVSTSSQTDLSSFNTVASFYPLFYDWGA